MQLSEIGRLFAFRAFLLRRVSQYALAEILIHAGNVAPSPLKEPLWNAGLRLNPYHIPALLHRALYWNVRGDARTAAAFHTAAGVIENRSHLSASDLALTIVPQRLWQRVFRQDPLRQETARKEQYAALAKQFNLLPSPPPLGTAPLAGPRSALRAQWASVEQAWTAGEFDRVFAAAGPLIERGEFVTPLDAMKWAEQFLQPVSPGAPSPAAFSHSLALAEKCLARARTWTPELGKVWQLSAKAAVYQGDPALARLHLDRAAALLPQDLSIFLDRWQLDHNVLLRESSAARLQVNGPSQLDRDATAEVECILSGTTGDWEIYALVPAGWGIVTAPRRAPLTAPGRVRFQITALRPDRICGGPWTLTMVARGDAEYVTANIRIAVPDRDPGRLLVLVTEDHELWEERGTLTRAGIERLLIDKSTFAADRFAPWTHMVEVGSTLALLEWAAAQDATWTPTRDAVRVHLAEQLARGSDLQPHLHAFNLPASDDFPFRLGADGLAVAPEFLLTAEEHRRDFARAYTPQERIAAVAATVARLEHIAHPGNPNYRPVLWRTGQLEFGDDPDDRAWSAVALLRAGLFADSDLPKQTFTRALLPRTAFFAALDDPYQPEPGGALLELPVTSNLEGDFLTDTRALCDIARQTAVALRRKPGVHVVTLLTHDKFINARRGADEFRLDENYNEWQTIRAHLDAWHHAGAERVTAQQAIAALLEDGAFHPVAWLGTAVWRTPLCVRYPLRLLGANIPFSDEYPQWVRVTIPPFLRSTLVSVRAFQGAQALSPIPNGPNEFWLSLTSRTPAPECEFELCAAPTARGTILGKGA